jgi:very-short-patch-repair endonuclease
MSRIEIARRLRREATDAERKLWSRLRGSQLRGLKFRRQMPIGAFIADFACVKARLAIEVDGGQHADTVDGDRIRTDVIESAGYLVIRFWNEDVMRDIDGVMDEIERVLAARPTNEAGIPSTASPAGRGL